MTAERRWLKKLALLLAMAGLLVFLLWITACSQEPAAPFTYTDTYTNKIIKPQGSDGTTAALFLIDESGGVSGKCPQPGQVLVTDSAGLRYDVVRFFLTLWEAYYSEQWLLPGVQGIHSNLVNLHVGVIQFADGLADPALPFTPASKLAGSDAWNSLYQRSQSSEGMLGGQSFNWFCHTRYSEVLGQLADHFPPQASRRIVVLFTDGSFRGTTEAARDASRCAAKDALTNLSDQGVEIYVMLLGKSMCSNSEGTGQADCQGISQTEQNRRAVDLEIWEALRGSGKITLLDEQNPFESTGGAMDSLLPGRLFQTGWLSATSKQALPSFLGHTARARVVAITSQPPEIGMLQLRDENNLEISLQPQQEQWLQGDKQLPDGTPGCQPLAPWRLESRQDMSVYYWIVPDHDVPSIRYLELSPEQVVLNENRHIIVTTHLGGRTNCRNCYRLIVTVGDDVGGVQKEVNLGEVSDLVPLEFDLPLELDWGPLPVRAQLTYEQSPEIPLGFQPGSFQVRFQPQVSEIVVAPSTDEGLASITVPIHYAAKVPGFEAHFALFTDQFGDPSPALLPQTSNCTSYGSIRDAEGWIEEKRDVITSTMGHTIFYTLTVPIETVSADHTCFYPYLRVRWTGASGEQVHWAELNPAVSTPMPTATPTATPINDDPPPFCAAYPALVIGATICGFSIVRRRGK